MILSKDSAKIEKDGKGKGTRTKANEKFATVLAATRTKLLNATVLIRTSDNRGVGTGIILNVAEVGQTKTAYVLTAKHLLQTLSDPKDVAGKLPSQCATQAFIGRLRLYYGPAAMESAPAVGPVGVTAVNLTGSIADNWLYDVMVLEATDAAFCTFIEGNAFIFDRLQDYQNLLPQKPEQKQSKDGENQNKDEKQPVGPKVCGILNKEVYDYIQLGYGAGKSDSVSATAGYEDKSGLIQCRWPPIEAKKPLVSAFDIEETIGKGKKKVYAVDSTYENVIEVPADVSSSTGPGDSGGPLFALKKDDNRFFYLVGVTSGMNFFSKPEWRQDPSKATKNDTIANNISTYWDGFFGAWAWYE